MRYTGKADGVVGPVFQTFPCAKNTDYVLTAALKSDQVCRPLVQVLDRAQNKAIASVFSEGQQGWTVFSARFSSGQAETLEVQVFGDLTMVSSGTVTAGTSGIDDVQVYLAAEAPVAGQVQSGFTPPGANLALNKPYTFTPAPNYSYCTDPDDKVQLTDGVYSVGYFWVQKSTVGWNNANPVTVTIDMEKVEPIAGMSYNTAAGVAGVAWPTVVLMLVSDDGKEWTSLGDLIRLSTKAGAPLSDVYSVHRFATGELKARGRYVRLIVSQAPYCFVDEIEVYRGPDELLAQVPVGKRLTDTKQLFVDVQAFSGVQWRMRSDLAAARAAVTGSALPQAEKDALLRKAEALSAQIDAMSEELAPGFRAVLPLNEIHAGIYAINAPLLRGGGFGPLTAWAQNRWDPLSPLQAPETATPPAPELRVDTMRNESRAEVLNLTNATDSRLTVTLSVGGLPGGENPPYLSVRDVLFTDTARRVPIASVLPDAVRGDAGYALEIPAGTTKQVWFSFRPRDVEPGEYKGQVVIKAGQGIADVAVPLTLVVYPFVFPEQPTMSLGGWDYTNGGGKYYRAPGNLESLMKNLREHYVDTPWGTGAVQPKGMEFDTAGHLTNPEKLDFAAWDEWTELWKGARNYYVFLSVGDSFSGEKMGTPRFNTMVGDWMIAWVEHLKKQGLKPSQLGVLLVDEPGGSWKADKAVREDETILTWAKAIRAVEPDVVIWEDPVHPDPAKGNPEMFANCSALCPHTPMFMASPQAFRDFYVAQQKAGRTLWFYSCMGPSMLLDPYSYHRGQPWWAIQYGAVGGCYWALGCGGGIGNSWNAYAQAGVEYSPFFVGQDAVTDAKQWEAVREGVQDYEYFVMLRKRVAELDAKGVTGPAVDAAKKLLTDGPVEVTSAINEKILEWSAPKDRGIMDRVRVQALQALSQLQGL